MSNKLKVVVYQEGVEVFKEECNSYLIATQDAGGDIKCGILAKSQKNMRHLMASGMAAVLGILFKEGITQEDAEEFFEKAMKEMSNAEQQVKANEPLQ